MPCQLDALFWWLKLYSGGSNLIRLRWIAHTHTYIYIRTFNCQLHCAPLCCISSTIWVYMAYSIMLYIYYLCLLLTHAMHMTASYVYICLYTCSYHSEPRASKHLHLQLPRQHRQPGRSAHGLARRPQLRAWRWVWKLEIPPILHQLVAINGISTIFEMGKLWKMRVSVSNHCMFWAPYF